jgi:hypothetical protein
MSRRRLRDERALVAQQLRCRDVVMDRRRADLDRAVLLANAGEAGMRAMSMSLSAR